MSNTVLKLNLSDSNVVNWVDALGFGSSLSETKIQLISDIINLGYNDVIANSFSLYDVLFAKYGYLLSQPDPVNLFSTNEVSYLVLPVLNHKTKFNLINIPEELL
jgi:hypothetical protein